MEPKEMQRLRVESKKNTEKAISDFIANSKDERGKALRLVPERFKPLFYRVYSANKSRKDAMRAKCLDCCCYKSSEVDLCEIKTCPLWEFRK